MKTVEIGFEQPRSLLVFRPALTQQCQEIGRSQLVEAHPGKAAAQDCPFHAPRIMVEGHAQKSGRHRRGLAAGRRAVAVEQAANPNEQRHQHRERREQHREPPGDRQSRYRGNSDDDAGHLQAAGEPCGIGIDEQINQQQEAAENCEPPDQVEHRLRSALQL